MKAAWNSVQLRCQMRMKLLGLYMIQTARIALLMCHKRLWRSASPEGEGGSGFCTGFGFRTCFTLSSLAGVLSKEHYYSHVKWKRKASWREAQLLRCCRLLPRHVYHPWLHLASPWPSLRPIPPDSWDSHCWILSLLSLLNLVLRLTSHGWWALSVECALFIHRFLIRFDETEI